MQGSQNGTGPSASAAPSLPAAGQPVLASKPSLRAPPSRPAPSRQAPLDFDRIDFNRPRPGQRSDQPRQQNSTQAPPAQAPIPGAPLEAAQPGVRPSSRGGKKGKQEEDDDGDKGKGKGQQAFLPATWATKAPPKHAAVQEQQVLTCLLMLTMLLSLKLPSAFLGTSASSQLGWFECTSGALSGHKSLFEL